MSYNKIIIALALLFVVTNAADVRTNLRGSKNATTTTDSNSTTDETIISMPTGKPYMVISDNYGVMQRKTMNQRKMMNQKKMTNQRKTMNQRKMTNQRKTIHHLFVQVLNVRKLLDLKLQVVSPIHFMDRLLQVSH